MAQSTERKRFVFHQHTLDRNQNIFKKTRKTTGATKFSWQENKAIRSKIQGEDDPQKLPHTRVPIVKDKKYIGINFWWYIATISKINFTKECLWLKI